MTFSFSRDDSDKFLKPYVEQKILPGDPFESIDQTGVGELMKIAVYKGTHKIAVEIKTFRRVSSVEDLQDALGQFVMYRDLLAEIEPEREVFVAVPDEALDGIFAEELGQILLKRGTIRVFGYASNEEVLTRWLP